MNIQPFCRRCKHDSFLCLAGSWKSETSFLERLATPFRRESIHCQGSTWFKNGIVRWLLCLRTDSEVRSIWKELLNIEWLHLINFLVNNRQDHDQFYISGWLWKYVRWLNRKAASKTANLSVAKTDFVFLLWKCCHLRRKSDFLFGRFSWQTSEVRRQSKICFS